MHRRWRLDAVPSTAAAQVRGADHVAGGAVRQIRRGGRRRGRRAVHVIAAGVLERGFVGRTVLQPALEQRHERRGSRPGRWRWHVRRDQLPSGLLRLDRLLVLVKRRFLLLHCGRRGLMVSATAAVGHAGELRAGHQIVYGDVGKYTSLAVLRRAVGVFVRGPLVACHTQPLVRAVNSGPVVAAGRHRGVRAERRAAHQHLKLVELVVDERVLLLELGQARVSGRRHQVLVLVVHVVIRRGRVVVVLGGHSVVGRDRLVMVTGDAVDVDALGDCMERHQRFEVGEVRGRLRVVVIVVSSVVVVVVVGLLVDSAVREMRRVMVTVVTVLRVVVMVVVVMMVVLLRGHGDRRTVGSVLIASQ